MIREIQHLSPKWSSEWKGKDIYHELLSMPHELIRELPGKSRVTIRFTKDNEHYFAKLCSGIKWRKILKHFCRFEVAPVGLKNEWEAIKRLDELGINVPEIIAYGKKGSNYAKLKTFLILRELSMTESLKDYCTDWRTSIQPFALKRAIVRTLAEMAKKLHDNGIYHGDLCTEHFLLDISMGKENLCPDNLKIHLIDMHLSKIKRKLRKKYIIKDLVKLSFSCLKLGLTSNDIVCFLRHYFGQDLKTVFRENTNVLTEVHAGIIKYCIKWEKLELLDSKLLSTVQIDEQQL